MVLTIGRPAFSDSSMASRSWFAASMTSLKVLPTVGGTERSAAARGCASRTTTALVTTSAGTSSSGLTSVSCVILFLLRLNDATTVLLVVASVKRPLSRVCYPVAMPKPLAKWLTWPDPELIEDADPSKLTLREEKFAQEYCASYGRAVWAYCVAWEVPPYDATMGEEEKFAKLVSAQTSRVRRKPAVVHRILELQREALASTRITKNRIIGNIHRIAEDASALAAKGQNGARYMKVELDAWRLLAEMGGFAGIFAKVDTFNQFNDNRKVEAGPPAPSIEELAEMAKSMTLSELGGEDYAALEQRHLLAEGPPAETAGSPPPESPSPSEDPG